MNLVMVKKDIVEFLYRMSANDYPKICQTLGLKEGTVAEAFSSKRRFMYNRIGSMDDKQLLEVLRKIKINFGETLIPEEKYNYIISNVTKRDITEILTNGFYYEGPIIEEDYKIEWNGKLKEIDFIKRIADVSKIPTSDKRCKDFEDEYYFHREYNNDYPNDYFFTDNRLPYKNSNTETFLKILCEIFHPEVRDEKGDWKVILKRINELLGEDGYELYPESSISGRQVYAYRKIKYFDEEDMPNPSIDKIVEVINTKYIKDQVTLIKTNLDTNTALAIGKSKEILETCFKYIYESLGFAFEKEDNLLKMDKKVRKALSIDLDINNKNIKGLPLIASGLTNIIHGISEMRNNYGDGHGKNPGFNELEKVYAELAVNATASYIKFLLTLFEEKNLTI